MQQPTKPFCNNLHFYFATFCKKGLQKTYDGAYATKKIKELNPNIKILVLTTFDDDDTVNRALDSGVDGYILKEMEDYQIINAIKSTYAGINVLGRDIYQRLKEKKIKPSEKYLELSDKERELLAYIMKGYSNKEIASILNYAEGTVRNNISRLLVKLGLKDRTQLAVFAVQNGIE